MAYRSKGELLQIIQIKEVLILIFISLLKCVYAFTCICITLFLGYISFLLMIISFKDFPFQTVVFILFAIFIYILTWSLLFIKIKFYNKLLVFVFILIFIKFLFVIPAAEYAVDTDTCIDTGICKEGIQTKIDGKLTEINKYDCLKHNKEWYEIINSCNVR